MANSKSKKKPTASAKKNMANSNAGSSSGKRRTASKAGASSGKRRTASKTGASSGKTKAVSKAGASSAKTRTVSKAEIKKQSGKENGSGIPMASEIELIAAIGIMLLMMLANFGVGGYMSKALSSFFFGVFGCVQYVMPVAFCLGVFLLIANDYSLLSIKKCMAGFVALMMISAFAQIIYQGAPVDYSELFSLSAEDHHAGGILGGGFGLLLKKGFGSAGAMVIVLCCLLLALIMLTQRSFVGFFQNNVSRGSRFVDKVNENRELTKEKRREEKLVRKERHKHDSKEQDGMISSILGRKKEKVRNTEKIEADSSSRKKKVEEKLQQIQEARSKKEKENSAKTAAARLKQDPQIHGGAPIFTSSDEVKKKDSIQELKPQVYPFTAEDGRTKEFKGELDYSAFSFKDGEDADRYADDLSQASDDLKEFLDSLEEVVPASRKRSSTNSDTKELHPKAEDNDGELSNVPKEEDQKTDVIVEIISTEQGEEKKVSEDVFDVDMSSLTRQRAKGIKSASNEENEGSGNSDQIEEDFGDSKKSSEDTGSSKKDRESSFSFENIEKGFRESKKSKEASDSLDEGEVGLHRPRKVETFENDTKKGKNNSSLGSSQEQSSKGDTGDDIRINRADAPPKAPKIKPAGKEDYLFPPINLLVEEEQVWSESYDRELKETALKLQTTLESFGVHVTITDISCGPAVTRYEMFPEQGTKVSKIVSLTDDIKLNLAAADVRIEAPIPGKAAIGIEVPNKQTMTVRLRELIDNRLFRNFKSRLAFAVGKDIGGKIVVTDLAKMPHLLIAGATGSGKSVCINTLIMSLLYKAAPDEVKLIMIDPKMVELSVYNGIPHLLIPVVTDPKKASGALNWAVAEMTDRYKKFAETNVRNLEGYNKKVDSLIAQGEVDEEKLKRMPQIVIIIDELADLMMVAPGEVEDAIVRLSQLARAAGIHLVIATQRPSVNVITGLIKANVPSRIAFAVSSGVDSRTIIDMNGAEKLLGKGDMLFFPYGYQKPVRVQGALVDDAEVANVVEFIKSNEQIAVYDDGLSDKIEKKIDHGESTQERDEYFEAAARFIMEKDKATIGMLQRMFKIGFNRAARIMDQLAEAGIVGPEEGTKPRQILMTPEQLDEYFENYV